MRHFTDNPSNCFSIGAVRLKRGALNRHSVATSLEIPQRFVTHIQPPIIKYRDMLECVETNCRHFGLGVGLIGLISDVRFTPTSYQQGILNRLHSHGQYATEKNTPGN